MIDYHDDSIDSAFIERQLEFVKAKTYDKKYPDFKARQLLPVSHETSNGAETVKYNVYDMRGIAKVIKSYADDLPRADVVVKEERQAVKPIGAAYGYSVQELRASQLAGGVPLEQRKANAARRAIEARIDKIASLGDSVNGLIGLLNVTNAQTYTIPAGVSTHTDWARKTGLEMLADLNLASAKIPTSTFDVEHPTTIVLPINQYALIGMTPVNTGIPKTVREHFLESSEWVSEIMSWYRLSNAGSGGTTDRMLVYTRDADHIWLDIPQEFEQFPAQQVNLEFKVACHARIAGVICPYPFSVLYADGI
jgi:hypothetical protein